MLDPVDGDQLVPLSCRTWVYQRIGRSADPGDYGVHGGAAWCWLLRCTVIGLFALGADGRLS